MVATLSGGSVPPGERVVIRYDNTFAPYVAEKETVWLRVKGEAPKSPLTVTVRPGPHKLLRILAPSGVAPGQLFDVLLVSLDACDNASCTRFENETLFLDDGTPVKGDIRFRGTTRIPVRLDATGVHRFMMWDTMSNAVRVAEGGGGPYWGDIHIHTKLSSDAQGDNPYAYARDVSGLDFAGTADHVDSLGEEGYRITSEWAADALKPGKFVTVYADERNPKALTGHHNIYFRTPEAFRKHMRLPGEADEQSPEEEAAYLQTVDPSDVMLVPHHTGIAFRSMPQQGIGCAVDWEAWDDKGLRPVMEIYSHHGQSETCDAQHFLAYEFNRMRNPERRRNISMPGPFYAQDHWMAGRRIGVIGSSDEHSGQGGRRHGGIAAVHAAELSRDGIFEALRKRHCYATTGERILVEFSVNGTRMGDCLDSRRGETLDISLKVWGTNLLLCVELLRFRFGEDSAFRPIFSDSPRPESLDAAYEVRETVAGPCLYYARVVQEPLAWPGMAWTSPVWIDVEGE
jgi:hypothetical protein